MGRSLEGVLRRRDFISLATGAAIATTLLPSLPVVPDSYWCECKLVQYFRQPEGHFAASHILVDGQLQRFDYRWFCWRRNLHSKSRMWFLIEVSRHRPLSNDEKTELQQAFIQIARNDVRVLRSERS
jgi:hypothetical protein